MNKKYFFQLTIFFILGFSLSACIKVPNSNLDTTTTNNDQLTTNADGTTTDPDGFVRFPIEPTRQTTKYVILEDICTQFTQKFMEKMIGKTISKLEPSKIGQLYNCSYYFDDTKYLMLRLEYLNSENMKKGHETLGRKVESNPSIPMKNYVVYQENGQINEIYLILSVEKFLSFNPSSTNAMTNEEMTTFAQRLATKIKDMQ